MTFSKDQQLQLLLDLTNQVVSNLELRDLVRAISKDVRRVTQCDYATLLLPEPGNKLLRVYAVDFPEGKGVLSEVLVLSVEEGLAGTAYRTMKSITLQGPSTEWMSSPVHQIAVREGLQSFCFLPLIRRTRAIGLLGLGRLTNEAFSDTDLIFLTQVSNQVDSGNPEVIGTSERGALEEKRVPLTDSKSKVGAVTIRSGWASDIKPDAEKLKMAYEEIDCGEPIHKRIPSRLALRRKAAAVEPRAALLWYSGDSKATGRRSVMAYVSVRDSYWPWYAALEAGETWRVTETWDIKREDLSSLMELGSASHPSVISPV